MHCESCGSVLKNGANFCTNCGSNVVKKDEKPLTNNNVVSDQTDGKATASLIIGIISVIFAFIFNILSLPLPIVGIILGINSKGKSGSKTAGIVLNLISFVIMIVMLIVILIVGINAIKKVLN